MRIVWDEQKRLANLDKHGLDFVDLTLEFFGSSSMTTKTFTPGRGYTEADWSDVDSPEFTDEELAQAKPFAEVFPELAASIKRSVGRPRLDNARQAVTLRVTPETLRKFEGLGPDWRARMAEILEKAKV